MKKDSVKNVILHVKLVSMDRKMDAFHALIHYYNL